MEKRNLKVDLNTAKEWYKSGNEALKELALQVFTEEELTFNFAKLVNPIIMRPVLHTFDHVNRAAALEKLQILADYFNTYRNKGKRQLNINGYFLQELTTVSIESSSMIVYVIQELCISWKKQT